MILFAILMIILACLITFVVFAVGLGGSIFIIIFADVIVCIAIIFAILRFIKKRKSNR